MVPVTLCIRKGETKRLLEMLVKIPPGHRAKEAVVSVPPESAYYISGKAPTNQLFFYGIPTAELYVLNELGQRKRSHRGHDKSQEIERLSQMRVLEPGRQPFVAEWKIPTKPRPEKQARQLMGGNFPNCCYGLIGGNHDRVQRRNRQTCRNVAEDRVNTLG